MIGVMGSGKEENDDLSKMAHKPIDCSKSINSKNTTIMTEPADASDSFQTGSLEDSRNSFQIKSEFPGKVEKQNSEELINAELLFNQNLIRPCIVLVHRFLNLQELSSCNHCKKTIHFDLQNDDNGGANARTNEKRCNNDLNKAKALNGQCCTSGNDASMMKNDRSSSIEPNQVFGRSLSASEGRIIKCMFRKILPPKSRSKQNPLKKTKISKSVNRVKSLKTMHKCNECGKKFSAESRLNIHLRVHSGGKLFKCEKCKKELTRRHDLKRHLLTHSGEKPFKCLKCEKAFIRRRSLNDHLRVHSAEKPLQK